MMTGSLKKDLKKKKKKKKKGGSLKASSLIRSNTVCVLKKLFMTKKHIPFITFMYTVFLSK